MDKLTTFIASTSGLWIGLVFLIVTLIVAIAAARVEIEQNRLER